MSVAAVLALEHLDRLPRDLILCCERSCHCLSLRQTYRRLADKMTRSPTLPNHIPTEYPATIFVMVARTAITSAIVRPDAIALTVSFSHLWKGKFSEAQQQIGAWLALAVAAQGALLSQSPSPRVVNTLRVSLDSGT